MEILQSFFCQFIFLSPCLLSSCRAPEFCVIRENQWLLFLRLGRRGGGVSTPRKIPRK